MSSSIDCLIRGGAIRVQKLDAPSGSLLVLEIPLLLERFSEVIPNTIRGRDAESISQFAESRSG